MKLHVALAAALTLCMMPALNVVAQQNCFAGYVNRQAPMVRMSGYLQLVETIPLPTVGKMDHLAYDLKRQHLFISGEVNNEVVVVDLRTGKVIHVTHVSGNPRKPFFDPELNELWVDLGDNTAVAIDGTTFAVTKTVALTGGKNAQDRDPDNAAYDPIRKLYYVGVRNKVTGTKQGSIEIVDTRAAKLAGRIPLDVDEPAGLALDPAGNRLYVGVGDVVNGQSIVKVVDTAKRAVIAEWPITGGPQPHVAEIDAAHHRLFLGSRLGGGHTEPGVLVVLSTDNGKLVQNLPAPGGGDELFYDAASSRIYFSGADGTMAVYHEDDPNHFRLLSKVPTGPIAKSGIWIPELKRYYAAVPAALEIILPADKTSMSDWVTDPAHLMVFKQIP
ncbi:MAG TPA: hypothetical protein VNJ12_01990 [Candidatus Dormibacteraeota bacterium]|nr:hypothetical protein [Candidatus Dormibacteraeota bacterium]